jgi:thiosulfate/3-mercaptopyruvate sulfurtransferase
MASRLWWLLRYFGHPVHTPSSHPPPSVSLRPGCRVLSGGIQAWIAAGHPLSTDVPEIAAAPVMGLIPGGALVAGKAEVDAYRLDPKAVVLDARAPERYEGRSEPVDPRPGHIPGARSAPYAGNLIAPGGEFLDEEDIERRYRELGALEADTVVCYCGSGVTACHALLALAALGRADAILYEGSWSDWSSDPALPVATGPEP